MASSVSRAVLGLTVAGLIVGWDGDAVFDFVVPLGTGKQISVTHRVERGVGCSVAHGYACGGATSGHNVVFSDGAVRYTWSQAGTCDPIALNQCGSRFYLVCRLDPAEIGAPHEFRFFGSLPDGSFREVTAPEFPHELAIGNVEGGTLDISSTFAEGRMVDVTEAWSTSTTARLWFFLSGRRVSQPARITPGAWTWARLWRRRARCAGPTSRAVRCRRNRSGWATRCW